MKCELITWHDAGSDEDDLTTWSDDPGDGEDIVIQTVGWVVKETAKYVTVAMDLADDGQTHTRSRIPVGMIVSRKVLFDIMQDLTV